MRLLISILLLIPLSVAGACPPGAYDCFLCGGVDGIPCEKSDSCKGAYSEAAGAYIACECPQGEPCVCYCPYGASATVVADEPSLIAQAPPCPEMGCQGPDCVQIQRMGGKVGIKTADGWCLARSGIAIAEGSKVWVLEGGTLDIMYSDGGRMSVRENSVFRLKELDTVEGGATTRLILDMAKGAFYHLTETKRKGQYEIWTNSVCTSPKGTEFIVETDGGSTTLKVLSGSVDFSKEGSDMHVLVGEGMSSTIGFGAAPSPPALFDTGSQPRWWEGSGCASAAILCLTLMCACFLKAGA